MNNPEKNTVKELYRAVYQLLTIFFALGTMSRKF